METITDPIPNPYAVGDLVLYTNHVTARQRPAIVLAVDGFTVTVRIHLTGHHTVERTIHHAFLDGFADWSRVRYLDADVRLALGIVR